MKKDKKLLIKAEKEALRKSIILCIGNELKSLVEKHQASSGKLNKTIDKSVKKLSKSIIKDIKVKLSQAPAVAEAPVEAK